VKENMANLSENQHKPDEAPGVGDAHEDGHGRRRSTACRSGGTPKNAKSENQNAKLKSVICLLI